MRKIIACVSYAFLILGAFMILLKGFLPEYIDVEGFLHEAFFLLPLGFGCIAIGIVLFVVHFFIRKQQAEQETDKKEVSPNESAST